MELTCRVLRPGDAADVAAVQRVLRGAPGYHLLIEGRPPSATAAADLFTELPPGRAAADKQILGFFVGQELAGCADLVRGYPSPDVAYLGLLILEDRHRGQGHGTAALAHVTQVAHSWGCRYLRLAVIATNEHGHHFWMRQGFVELYRKDMPSYTGEAIVMQRALGTAAGS
jgi:GNAT superfamily N-acetyltransferase